MSLPGLLTCLGLGFGSHILFFIRGEHHMRGPVYAVLLPIAWGILMVAGIRSESLLSAAETSTLLLSAYLTGLYSSILIYRTFLHPLRNVPGPPLAKVSKFWHVAKLSSLHNHTLLEELRHKYGDIVRTGPNEVVVFTPEGVPAVHGPSSKCIKSDWYDMLQKDQSIHATRNPQLHTARRRIWDQGFGTKALLSYQKRVQTHVDLLDDNLARSAGEPLNCTELFLFFGFDVMGDTAFGQSFDMLKSNQIHSAVEIMRSGLYVLGRLTPVPWLIRLLSSIAGTRDFERLEQFAREQVLKRIKLDRDEADVMSKLIEAARDPNDKDKVDMTFLPAEATVMVIAGSDTVSIALTFLFYHLTKLPHHVQKLREELHQVEDISDARALQPLRYLNALINETLRLFPPVPTAPLRQTPSEGLQIGDRFIPGGVTISTPMFSLGRLESSYPQAESFIPERWYSDSMINNKSGFAPFLSGTHSCLGKQLALIELRLVTARIVTAYDFEFAQGTNGSEVLDFEDCFTAVPGPLRLVFKPRS